MRPLTLGVLLSTPAPPARSPAGASVADDRAAHVRALEGLADLRSGSDIVGALADLGHVARPVGVDGDLDLALRQSDIDACLLALHGPAGGCGDVQSLLTVRGVPFFGPAGSAAALAFDKVRSRQVLGYHNLPVPASIALGPRTKTNDRALELLGWPCLVKPRRGALGLGVAPLTDPADVSEAIGRALAVDTQVLLERAVDGTEIQVVLLGDRVLGSAELLGPPGPDGANASLVCPPRISRGRLDGAHSLARRAVAALGLEDGLTRVDIMLSDRHNEVILEVEPLPPLCRDGVVARVAAAVGIVYEDLISMLVDRIVLRAPEPRLATGRALLQ
jgi:D-alanine-D-alanine ligase